MHSHALVLIQSADTPIILSNICDVIQVSLAAQQLCMHSTSSSGTSFTVTSATSTSTATSQNGVSTSTLEQIVATSLDIVCTALARQPQSVALLLKVKRSCDHCYHCVNHRYYMRTDSVYSKLPNFGIIHASV
jgi:hypothetical protein